MGLSHRFHPDPLMDDPPEALLFDVCERCAEHADRPDQLDDQTLSALLNLTEVRTDNEARALTRITWATGMTRRAAAVAGLAVGPVRMGFDG